MSKYLTISIKFVLVVAVFSLLFIYSCKKITESNNDNDNDGIEDKIDNCIEIHNPEQIDTDGDGIGDECDSNNNDGPLGDPDEDGIPNNADSCPNDYNKGTDYNNDGIDDACDPLPPEYALTFGLYDDFDGNGALQTYNGLPLAVTGDLSDSLWHRLIAPNGGTIDVVELNTIVGDSVSYGANPSGNVVKMAHNQRGDIRLALINPTKIDFKDYFSWSADMMISSESTHKYFNSVIDYHTSIPEQPPGISWYCNTGLLIDSPTESIYKFAHINNKNTSYQFWSNIEPATTDVWYNFRMDIVQISENQLEVRFYVNGELKAVEIPEDSEILLDPSRLAFGPIRSFSIWTGEYNPGTMVAYIDNVKAVYADRIQ